MKRLIVYPFTVILLVLYCSLYVFAYESPPINVNNKNTCCSIEENPSCGQWGVYNDETMTLSEIYENTLIDDYIKILGGREHPNSVCFFKDGKQTTNGKIEEGMVVRIYQNSKSYKEYTVSNLKKLAQAPRNNENNTLNKYSKMLLMSSNIYGFTLPIDNMNITTHISSTFGYRIDPITGSMAGHNGIDISWENINGTEIKAVKDGTVIESRYQYNESTGSGYGYMVIIDHGNGEKTLYGHMLAEKFRAHLGPIKQGDTVGYVGSTGGSTGSHLHFEVRQGDYSSFWNCTPVDPIPYLTGAQTYNPKPITYTVNYNANGGTGAPVQQTKTHDVMMTLSNVQPTKPGYNFLGWATTSKATTPEYKPGSNYSSNANITLYALWAIPSVPNTPNLNRTYGSYCLGNFIKSDQRINVGEYIMSPNKQFIAIMQSDGNFVVYNSDCYLWATGTGDPKKVHGEYVLTLKAGDIVIDDPTRPNGESERWRLSKIAPSTASKAAAKLDLENDGRLVVHDSSNDVVWSSENRGLYPYKISEFDYVVTVNGKSNSQLHRTNGTYCIGSSLKAGGKLNVNEYIASPNGEFIAIMQSDGNFVVYNKERYLWATWTSDSTKVHGKYFFTLQYDGNIVLYDPTRPNNECARWNSFGNIFGTSPKKAATLDLENDGRLVARDSNRKVIWVSRAIGYPYHNANSSVFDIVYNFNVALNIDNNKNPFAMELNYSITDGKNTYKSDKNGKISIPNTENANYQALIYEKGAESPFCNIDLTPGNYKCSSSVSEKPYEIRVEKSSKYNTQITVAFYQNGDLNLNDKLDTEDIKLLAAYVLGGYNFIQTGSSTDLTLGKTGSNITVNGNISANGNFKLYKSNANINGVLSAKNYWENNVLKDPANYPPYFNQINEFIQEYFDDEYMTKTFFTGDIDIFNGDKEFIDNNININKSTFVDGNALLRGNVNINSNFRTTNNINIEGNVQNTSGFVIYSKTGDITLGYNDNYSANINFNGFIYAPNGKVTIKGDNITITGTIIAKEIIIEGNCINFNVGALNQITGCSTQLSLTQFQILLADVNVDGKINVFDLASLKRKFLNQANVA